MKEKLDTGEEVWQEYLAVLVSCAGVYEEGKLLGIIPVTDATGATMTDTVMALLREWKLDDKIVAMVFDTTSSNSGCVRGASVRVFIRPDQYVKICV